jgi:hypothetical protein
MAGRVVIKITMRVFLYCYLAINFDSIIKS